MMKYGVVQGRLTPLRGNFIQEFPSNWRHEFDVAVNLGVSHIEWIDGAPGDDRTLERSFKQSDMIVPISGICLDWFVNADIGVLGLLNGPRLESIIQRASELGIRTIVMPFLENSSLRTLLMHDNAFFKHVMHTLGRIAIKNHLSEFSIETDLDANELADVLSDLPSNVSITFDTGNLTRLGYDLSKHIAAYGRRVKNIHVKDCFVGGSSVELGMGDAQLHMVRDVLHADYMTFQTARSPGNEVETYRHNVITMDNLLCP